MKKHRNNWLLILNRIQFGYHLDAYYYCKYGPPILQIKYVCFDLGRPKVQLDGVAIEYVLYTGRKVLRYLRLLVAYIRETGKCPGVVFVEYFVGCSLLKLLWPRKRMILDIRTGSISPNPMIRRLKDKMISLESRAFRNITAISQSLADRLSLPSGITHILPLGAESMPIPDKRFDRLDLLYVGTLDGRRIKDTIFGFAKFFRNFGQEVEMSYTIVGDGRNGQLDKLRTDVLRLNLENNVRLLGYIHKSELEPIFEECNLGVSYVPMTEYYDCQPATKTFEYILAGMPVIATATTENKKLVNKQTGVLIQDSPQGFCHGLTEFFTFRSRFDSNKIRLSCLDSSWPRIVTQNLIPYVHSIS